ncbi:hypothetical protein QL285_062614 [Trifolium repens]|nr:hypothetical protein QL285_062614 [Trifolium repens]
MCKVSNSSASTISSDVNGSDQSNFHLHLSSSHQPIFLIDASWFATLTYKDGNKPIKSNIPSHFSFQNAMIFPSPNKLLTFELSKQQFNDTPTFKRSRHHNDVLSLLVLTRLCKKLGAKDPYRKVNIFAKKY